MARISARNKDDRIRGMLPKLLAVVLSIVLAFCMVGCSSYSSGSSSTSNSSNSTGSSGSSGSDSSSNGSGSSGSDGGGIKRATPTYEDPRWPTTDPELLAIPESDRYYNSKQKINSYGTIVGPVKEVYQAMNSNGQPVFIDIGADYPSSDRAQVVIWGQYVDEGTSNMLSEIDHGNAWISVTGYISPYDGVAEIDVSNGAVSYVWWTNVS